MKVLRIEQEKNTNKSIPRHRKTLRALGLRGRGSVSYRQDLMAIRGMLNHVQQVVSVQQVDGPVEKGESKRSLSAGYEVVKG